MFYDLFLTAQKKHKIDEKPSQENSSFGSSETPISDLGAGVYRAGANDKDNGIKPEKQDGDQFAKRDPDKLDIVVEESLDEAEIGEDIPKEAEEEIAVEEEVIEEEIEEVEDEDEEESNIDMKTKYDVLGQGEDAITVTLAD